MSGENFQAGDFAEPEGPEPARPELPDGIGLSYEEVSRMLLMKHKTAVSLNDPVMMLVTVCNAFLEELRGLHGRHSQALSRVMAEETAGYVNGIKKASESLGQTLADASVEAIRKIFDEHGRALRDSRNNFRWCAAVVAVGALANVAALAVR